MWLYNHLITAAWADQHKKGALKIYIRNFSKTKVHLMMSVTEKQKSNKAIGDKSLTFLRETYGRFISHSLVSEVKVAVQYSLICHLEE